MELVPDTGLAPGGKPPPAGYARAEAQLLGQVLPLDAGVQDGGTYRSEATFGMIRLAHHLLAATHLGRHAGLPAPAGTILRLGNRQRA